MPKRNKIVKTLGIGACCLFLLGCEKESFFIQQEGSSTVVLEEVVAGEENTAKEDVVAGEEVVAGKDVVAGEENVAMEQDGASQKKQIAVHICGAVNHPGVYYLEENQRVCDGILKAGGFREDADEDYLNQALFLEDGMKITVPTKEETEAMNPKVPPSETGDFIETAPLVQGADTQQKVDLNTADETLLCTLPGIGKSRAQSIIAYRREHGAFENTEDIMKVSGIKEAAYEKIKDYVTVSQ